MTEVLSADYSFWFWTRACRSLLISRSARGIVKVTDRLGQFVQQPLQTFILSRPFNPQHLDFYCSRPVGRIEHRKGGAGSSPKSKPARQHRHPCRSLGEKERLRQN